MQVVVVVCGVFSLVVVVSVCLCVCGGNSIGNLDGNAFSCCFRIIEIRVRAQESIIQNIDYIIMWKL